jgi:outer membrane protein OmpA-like peptidoglycan-associated protein
MKSLLILPFVCGAALVTACSATPPPKELVDARAEMAQARSGAAHQNAPAQLHVAEEELNLAEQECASDCGSDKTKDRAYIALRKVQLAEAESRLALASNEAAQASQQVQLTQAQMNANTRTELAQTKDQLAQAKLQAQQAMADLARVAATKEDERGLIITLNGSVLFATNKDVLLGAADTKLDQVAESLKGKLRGRMIEVQGYTDSQGAADYNIGLSQRRADSVRSYLVGKGVPADKISARGYGKDRPVADNATAEGRADNRRVEIVVKPADGSVSSTN